MEILHLVSILNFYHLLHVILQGGNKFCVNWTITEIVMTLCRFLKMAAIPLQIFFYFLLLWHLGFRKAKNYLRIKFRPDISIHGQVITTSGCWSLKTNVRSTSTSAFDELFTVIGMLWLCTGLPNFMQIGWSPTELWRHTDLQDGSHSVANRLPVADLATCHFTKTQSNRHNKFGPRISIHGRHISTSGFWKQTAAVLKF